MKTVKLRKIYSNLLVFMHTPTTIAQFTVKYFSLSANFSLDRYAYGKKLTWPFLIQFIPDILHPRRTVFSCLPSCSDAKSRPRKHCCVLCVHVLLRARRKNRFSKLYLNEAGKIIRAHANTDELFDLYFLKCFHNQYNGDIRGGKNNDDSDFECE